MAVMGSCGLLDGVRQEDMDKVYWYLTGQRHNFCNEDLYLLRFYYFTIT